MVIWTTTAKTARQQWMVSEDSSSNKDNKTAFARQ
jgi:hypothetical protein